MARALHGRTGRAFARLDLAGMRAIRSTARSKRATRKIIVFSRSGEHGALWLGIGALGAIVDDRRRGEWLLGVAAVGVIAGVLIDRLLDFDDVLDAGGEWDEGGGVHTRWQ